jgi:MFS transporter, ACS family, tartrate transporter
MARKSKAISLGAHSMSAERETRVLRKITLRIVPFVMLLFFVSFIDRATIGFAALAMNKNLGLSPSVFGFGAGIFLLGYLLFEVPPNLTLKSSARLGIPGAVSKADSNRC